MRQIRGIRNLKQLHQHWTWKKGVMKPKVQFNTLNDALEFLAKNNFIKQKYHPYICSDCGMWHIGHNK